MCPSAHGGCVTALGGFRRGPWVNACPCPTCPFQLTPRASAPRRQQPKTHVGCPTTWTLPGAGDTSAKVTRGEVTGHSWGPLCCPWRHQGGRGDPKRKHPGMSPHSWQQNPAGGTRVSLGGCVLLGLGALPAPQGPVTQRRVRLRGGTGQTGQLLWGRGKGLGPGEFESPAWPRCCPKGVAQGAEPPPP